MTMETLFHGLARGTRVLTTGCLALSVFLFMACLGVLAADIALRTLFNHPLQNVGEGVIIAFIYVYLVGGAALYARNDDIALDFLFLKAGVSTPRCTWISFSVSTSTIAMVSAVAR